MLIESIEQYIALRRATGCQFRVQASILMHFARFAETVGDTHVRTTTVLTWAAGAPSAGQQVTRLRIVRGFARHVALEDRRHEIPPAKSIGRPASRRPPFIYTRRQIAKIVAAAARLPPNEMLRPQVYATLFGLIAACGLRVSEALRLQLNDVVPDGLIIRETKSRKSRIVPLHPTARHHLTSYLAKRARVMTTDSAVFLSSSGIALSYPTVVSTFLAIVRSIGLRSRHGRGPRIHDLRHTFAVRSLEKCPRGRGAVARHMLALSTYLGHAHIADTYWYLQATPLLLRSTADIVEAAYKGRDQ